MIWFAHLLYGCRYEIRYDFIKYMSSLGILLGNGYAKNQMITPLNL